MRNSPLFDRRPYTTTSFLAPIALTASAFVGGIAAARAVSKSTISLAARFPQAARRNPVTAARAAWGHDHNQLESDLRNALDRDQLAVEYQPVVDLSTGEVRSVEALIRWPGRPEVGAAKLIAVAEASDLIHDIGAWVMRRAFRDVAQLNAARAAHPPVGIAVNVSGRQLAEPTFVTEVHALLAAFAIEPRLVTVEVTETALAREPETATRTLAELRDLGVNIDVDDFGLGYSALARIGQFPIDGLKIDHSYVRTLGIEASAEKVVAAIVALAGALGMQVTAEGVESETQLRMLRALGCHLAQGFLFSRSIQIQEIEGFLIDAGTHRRVNAGLVAELV